MDPLELRRKNFIPTDDFPHETAASASSTTPATTTGTLDKLLEHFDLDAFRREQEELREQGVHRGVGFSHLRRDLRARAVARRRARAAAACRAAFWESAMVRVHATGSVTVYTGTSPHGQGHDTSFAQIAADRLGVDPGRRRRDPRRHRHRARGAGTPTARARWRSAARRSRARREKVQDKAKRIARALLEAAPEDIELADGKFQVRARRTSR